MLLVHGQTVISQVIVIQNLARAYVIPFPESFSEGGKRFARAHGVIHHCMNFHIYKNFPFQVNAIKVPLLSPLHELYITFAWKSKGSKVGLFMAFK